MNHYIELNIWKTENGGFPWLLLVLIKNVDVFAKQKAIQMSSLRQRSMDMCIKKIINKNKYIPSFIIA